MSVDVLTWEERAVAAEKTVEVLKTKIHALHNGHGVSTIQRQLEQTQRRQEAASRRRELVEVRAAELAKYTATLEREVADRTRDIRTILDNVTSGFLIVGPDLVVRAGYTESCHTILSTDAIAGRPLTEVLQIRAELDASHFALTIEQVFSDVLPEEVAFDIVPRRFPIGDRVVRLDGRAIRHEGEIAAILLTINDITSLEAAQRDAFMNKVLIGILKQRTAFQSFAVDARMLFGSAREALASDDVVSVRRALHTVKGNAAAFDLAEVVDTIHTIESYEDIVLSHVDTAEASLRRFFETHAAVLEMAYDAVDEELYEVSGAAVDALREAARCENPNAVERWTSTIVLKRADHVAGPLGLYVEKLAARLEKRVDFALAGGEVLLDARSLRPIFQNLAHVLRNAVDHGIEPDGCRGEKDACGRLEVRISDQGPSWSIAVEDDGRGIDPDHVARLAVQKGFASAAEIAAMSDGEKSALVFRDGFSTTDVATDVSGRGIGMSAVKAAVEQLGGRVDVRSTKGRGTCVELVVPKPVGLILRAAA